MKTLTSLLFIFVISMSSLFAQDVVTNDSTTQAEDSVEVVITPKKGQDSTIVKVGGMKIIVLNDGKKTNEIIIDDEWDENADSDEDKDDDDDDNDDKVSHWAGIRLGVNGYLLNDNIAMPASHDFLELDYAKSISWDLNLLEKDFRIVKNNVELVTGLGFHFANYNFKNDYATLSNTDPLSATLDSTRILEKNRLKATYLTAPLMIGFSTSQDEDKAFRLAVGGQVSWRLTSKLKQKYTFQGETYKPKVKSDYDLNPFLFHAVASVGYGPVNVYANYALNSLFENGKTLNLTPFDIGLQFMF